MKKANVEIKNLNLNSKQKRVLRQQEKKNSTLIVDSANKNVKGEIISLNLSKLKTENFQFSTGVQNNKAEKYKYPANWSPIMKQNLGKAWRTAKRKEIDKFAKFMEIAVHNNNSTALINLVKEFKVFYETFYLVNDFSAQSLSDSKNQVCENFILDCCKEINLQTAKKSAPKTKVAKKSKLKVALKKDTKPGFIDTEILDAPELS